jgi:hypothetical protein
MKPRGNGVVQFLLSIVLTHGINKIKEEMDDVGNHLIGNYGYCTQEMINLLLTGIASSNVFDGETSLDGTILKGVTKQSNIGYLTQMETFNYVKVTIFIEISILIFFFCKKGGREFKETSISHLDHFH